MARHSMRLTVQPFDSIVRGDKTIEIRLLDEKRRLIKVGDEIVFSRMEKQAEIIMTKVIGLQTADSFIELFSQLDLVRAGWPSGTTTAQAVKDVRVYYSEDTEKTYGTVAISIVRI